MKNYIETIRDIRSKVESMSAEEVKRTFISALCALEDSYTVNNDFSGCDDSWVEVQNGKSYMMEEVVDYLEIAVDMNRKKEIQDEDRKS